MGIGLNYADHVSESGLGTPAEQLWFSKPPTASNGPYDPIVRPRVSNQLDYEAELVIVIGKRCRYADAEAAAGSPLGPKPRDCRSCTASDDTRNIGNDATTTPNSAVSANSVIAIGRRP